MQGARWVQREILEKHPETELQVYAVWFDVLLGDDRSAWNPGLLFDPRVTQYWDSDRTLGTWFPRQEEYKPVIFGPMAATYSPIWPRGCGDVPAPLITSGSTIIAKRDRLSSGISQFLTIADDGQR